MRGYTGSENPAELVMDGGRAYGVTITATPDSGYSFSSWTGSGSYSGSSNSHTIARGTGWRLSWMSP